MGGLVRELRREEEGREGGRELARKEKERYCQHDLLSDYQWGLQTE